MSPGDFLVIYEDDSDDPDEPFVVDVRRNKTAALGEVDIEHDVRLGLSNTSSSLGTAGFIVTLVGTLAALGFMLTFGIGYPENWFDAQRNVQEGSFVSSVMLLGLVSFVLLFTGTVLSHYGRRIRATGHIDNIRVVQHA